MASYRHDGGVRYPSFRYAGNGCVPEVTEAAFNTRPLLCVLPRCFKVRWVPCRVRRLRTPPRKNEPFRFVFAELFGEPCGVLTEDGEE